jgi:hypothetical protein
VWITVSRSSLHNKWYHEPNKPQFSVSSRCNRFWTTVTTLVLDQPPRNTIFSDCFLRLFLLQTSNRFTPIRFYFFFAISLSSVFLHGRESSLSTTRDSKIRWVLRALGNAYGKLTPIKGVLEFDKKMVLLQHH